MTGPSDSNTKPSIALRSSRTLPDHGQSSRRAYASSSNCLGGRPWRSHSRASQYAISDGKSSMRSRRSGIDAAVTAIRWKRSIRNIPFAIAFFRSRWVSMRAPRETRLSMPLAAIRSRVSSGLPRRRADAERDSSDGGHSQGSADDAPMVTADTRALGHSGTRALKRFGASRRPSRRLQGTSRCMEESARRSLRGRYTRASKPRVSAGRWRAATTARALHRCAASRIKLRGSVAAQCRRMPAPVGARPTGSQCMKKAPSRKPADEGGPQTRSAQSPLGGQCPPGIAGAELAESRRPASPSTVAEPPPYATVMYGSHQ